MVAGERVVELQHGEQQQDRDQRGGAAALHPRHLQPLQGGAGGQDQGGENQDRHREDQGGLSQEAVHQGVHE